MASRLGGFGRFQEPVGIQPDIIGHVPAVKDRAIGREAPADGDMIGGHSRPQENQEAVAQDNVVGVTFL